MWHLFQLYRSIDLAQMRRVVSQARGKVFVTSRWEQVLQLPGFPDLCPWTLLYLYASLAENIVPYTRYLSHNFSMKKHYHQP